MSDHNTATIRTTVNTAVAMVVVLLASKVIGHEVSVDDPWVLLVVPVVVGFVQRLSTVVSENVPWVGYLLFGVNRSPAYTNPPPTIPALADEPEPKA